MAFTAPHVQNLDEALQLNIYVGECQRVLIGDVRQKITEAEEELNELLKVKKTTDKVTTRTINDVEFSVADRKSAREKCLSKKKVNKKRKWLQNLLLADSSSEDEANPQVDDMIRLHKVRLRCLEQFYEKPKLRRYKYYGANLIVNTSDVPETSSNVPPIMTTSRNGNIRQNSLTAGNTKVAARKPKKRKQSAPTVTNAIPVTSSLTVPDIMPSNAAPNAQQPQGHIHSRFQLLSQATSQTSAGHLEDSNVLESSSFHTTDVIADSSHDQGISASAAEAGALPEALPVCSSSSDNLMASGGLVNDMVLNVTPVTSTGIE